MKKKDISNYVMPFGKYKGEKIGQIYEKDLDYLFNFYDLWSNPQYSKKDTISEVMEEIRSYFREV